MRYSSIDANKKLNKNFLKNINGLKLEEKNFYQDNNINILKILKDLERKNTIQSKKNFNIKFLPSLKLPLNVDKSNQLKLNKSVDINNILTLKKSENENLSMNNYNNEGWFLTSLNIEKSRSINSINSYKEINKNNLRIPTSNRNGRNVSNKYNLSSIIKDIKKKNSSYVSKTEGNYFNECISYNNKNFKTILDINNILNKYLKNEEWNLKEKEDKYNDFVERKKGVCTNNVIIKLMKEQREKLNNKQNKDLNNCIEQMKQINEDEKIFEQLILQQKKDTRKIEDYYYKLFDNNRVLLYLRENFKEQVRKTEYEIMKKIYEIDELRIYAQFVNYIYGYDTSIYEKTVVNDDSTKSPMNSEMLVKNILENYKHLLKDESNDIINCIDPDIILNEIRLIEDRILINLKMRDQEYEDLKKNKKNNRDILKNIENKKTELENELSYYKKELEDIAVNTKINLEEDLYLIIKDFCLYILEIYCPDKKSIKKYKSNLNLFEITDLAEKSIKLLQKNESKLDVYMKLMEKSEIEDKKIFDSIINKRKEETIRDKTKKAKKNIELKRYLERLEIEKNNNKIYFIQKKAQPILPRKKKIVVNIDPEIIRAKENQEIITYV